MTAYAGRTKESSKTRRAGRIGHGSEATQKERTPTTRTTSPRHLSRPVPSNALSRFRYASGVLKWAPTTRERPGLLGPCFKTGRVGCRCTSLTRSGGRQSKAAPSNNADEHPNAWREPERKGASEVRIDAAAPVPSSRANPRARPRRWGDCKVSHEKETRKNRLATCLGSRMVPPSPAERGSTVAGPTEDDHDP